MMDDTRLDQLLDDAMRTYRVAPDAPVDEIWAGIMAEGFAPPVQRAVPGWRMVGIAAAAMLVIGVAAGRLSVGRGPTVVAAAPSAAAVPATLASAGDPNHQAASELLGRTAVLLAALPSGAGKTAVDAGMTREAARLLTTTRLLLDSSLNRDQELRDLLQDLELVLVQVARLQPTRHNEELRFIRSAMDEHDIVPRVRAAVTDLSLSDN